MCTFFRPQVVRDTREFASWLNGSSARGVSEGWTEWNATQLAPLRNDGKAQVGPAGAGVWGWGRLGPGACATCVRIPCTW